MAASQIYSDTYSAVKASMAPFWVELAFLLCFLLGFLFLRVERFRRLIAKPPKKVAAGKLDKLQEQEGFKPELQKSINVEAAAGNWKAVIQAWRAGCDDAPTPQEQLQHVVQAFLETEPESLGNDIAAHMKTHRSALANNRTAIAVLDLVARASKVELMMEVWGGFQQEFHLKRSLPVYEVLLGGFATVGNQDKVDELLGQLCSDQLKLSARGFSLLIKGFLKNGLVDAVFAQIVSMMKSGLAVPAFAVTQFFRVASEAGRIEETFLKAQEAGVAMPSEAIAVVLEDCARSSNFSLAEKVRSWSNAHDIKLSGSAYDSLLKLYAVAGDSAAMKLFQEMQSAGARISEGLCVAILARCAESKYLPFAEEIVRYRRGSDGMTIALYSSLMKVYAYSGMYDKACDLYHQILEDGLEPDKMMYGCLMKFAVDCGRTQLSQELSEKVPSLDIQNYMSLIRAAGRDGDVERALGVIKKLRASSVQIDVAAFNCVLDVCVKAKDLSRAQELLKEMKALGLLDVITYNTLLKGYCNAGDLAGAKFILREMSSEGLEPNDVSYNCIINAAVSSGKFQEAWSLIDTMVAKGIKIDCYTISIMMKALKMSGGRDVARVLDLLDRSGLNVCSDEILFNTVLETCIRAKEFKRLQSMVQQFEKSQLRPSVPTYGSLIKAMSSLKQVDRCWHYWQAMEEHRGLQPNDIVLGCMLDALVCNGEIDQAIKLFDQWKTKVQPNTVIYSILVKGFANSHQADRAMDACWEMRRLGLKMNTVVYNAIVDAHARCGKMEQVSNIMGFMREDGVAPDSITHSTIVKGYCVNGDLDRAFEVFKEMQSQKMIRDAIVYNTLLDGCARYGRKDMAELLLEDMEARKVTPTNFTLGILIKMYGRQKQLDKAFAALETLPKQGGFSPNTQVLTSLMSACLNNNAVEKALKVFEDLKRLNHGVADGKSYSALLSGLVRHGKLMEAVSIVNDACSMTRGKSPYQMEKILEPETVENLLSSLTQKGMMAQYGAPLLERLQAAGVSMPPAGACGGRYNSAYKQGQRRSNRGWQQRS
eukprot:TRINITY_DN534_c0_g1_i1.p1 TRINITY_DN534_c0_g1~~TRINITY_DN534_c0_g1_i1.p1  ORF type:complete len:1046 (-),score=300.81 TRINITY_DN534_c0_g1_i1:90-3227(-)